MSPLLSASLIVKDEAEFLPKCLASLRPFVDEIVVLDTGSEDDSVAIAERYGARVIRGEWTDHFGAARNAALEHCRGEWILAPDADEYVTGDPGMLRTQLRLIPDAWLLVNHSAVGPHGIWTPDALFRRRIFRWAGPVHEMPWLRDGLPDPGLPAHGTRNVRIHTRRSPARHDALARNLRVAEKAIAEDDDDPFPGYAEAMAAITLALLGDLGEGRALLDAAMAKMSEARHTTSSSFARRAIGLVAKERRRAMASLEKRADPSVAPVVAAVQE